MTTISDGWFRIVVLTKLVQGGREREREREVGETWSAIHPDERGNFREFWCFEIDFKLIGTGSYFYPPTICFGKLKISNRICFGVGKLWRKLHWTKHCLLSLGTKRVLVSLYRRVKFGSLESLECTSQWNQCRQPYSKFYMFQILVSDQFLGFSSCYVEKMTTDKQFGRVENTKSVSCACEISLPGRKQRMKMRVKPGSPKPTRPKLLLLQSFHNRFLYQEPSAPFSTMTRYWSQVPTSRLLGSGLSFQFSRCLLPCLVLQRLWNPEVSVANIGASSFQAFWVLWLGTSMRTGSPHQLLIALIALVAMPAMPRSVELAFLFWVLISWWMPSWHSWILTRHGGPWEVIQPDHGGIQPANVSRTDKGKKDRVSSLVSSCFLWLLQHFCTATSALACQGTDHPNKIFPQAKQVEKSKSAISCSTRKANTLLLKSLLEWGAVPSYQQGQKNVL